MIPGQFYPAGSLYNQGLSMGTPRNWAHGGQQMYDPQHVKPLLTDNGQRTLPPNTGQSGRRIQPGQQSQSNPASAPTGDAMNVQTGITAGPVLPQSVVASEQNRLRSFQPKPLSGQYAPFMQHLNDLVGGAMSTAATDFGRDAAFANAQQLLASQRAQAGAGTAWGSAMLGDYASQLGSQSQGLSAILSLLQSMMG